MTNKQRHNITSGRSDRHKNSSVDRNICANPDPTNPPTDLLIVLASVRSDSGLNSLEYWDYSVELECLTGPEGGCHQSGLIRRVGHVIHNLRGVTCLQVVSG